MASLFSPRLSRSVVAGQAKALNKVAGQIIEAARSKIKMTDFDALPEIERASAYAEVETLVRQAEDITSEASRLASRL